MQFFLSALNRKTLGGVLILAMILVTIVDGLVTTSLPFNLLWLSGGCGWLAATLLIVDTPRILQIQVGLLIAVGLSFFIIAFNQTTDISPHINRAISGNSGLLTMVAAVGFLRLVAMPETQAHEKLPIGKKAYLLTLLGINLSSTIINISAPILIADRIHRQQPLQRFTSQSFTRIFCGVATWSPFFGSMAVVLTFVEGAQLQTLILLGLPFTVFGFLVVFFEARVRYPEQVEKFVGYPMHLSGLTVPLILVATVIVLSWLLPDTAVLIIIALGALFVTVLILVFRLGPLHSLRQLSQYVVEGLPRNVNELALFLAAGVLASGMSMMIENGFVLNPFAAFDATTASLLLAIILIAAAVGIHPVILISSLTPMLITLEPNPSLLALTYLIAWNLGTCSSPLSGTHLVFQGRYGIPSWKAALWNWPYASVMFLIGVVWLQLVAIYFV